MKRSLVRIVTLVLSLLMLVSSFAISASALGYGDEWANYVDANTEKYSDVPSTHWAYNAIIRSSEKNWFNGYPDGSFRPTASITRGEAIKVFVMFLGLDYQSVDLSSLSFNDVSASDWYAPFVEAGKDLFPVHTNIQGKTPFNPNMPVTREDTIYALVKALGCDVGVKYVDQPVLGMFKDASSISGNLKSTMAIALQEGLVSGFPDSTIRGQAALSRAEFATLLLRGTEHGFHDKYDAKITSVSVMPTSPVEIEIGETVTLTARATYTDGSNQPYNSLSPYVENGNGIISLTGTTITGLKEGTATIKYNDSYLKNDSLTVIVKKPASKLAIKLYEYPEQTELSKITVIGEVIDADVSSVDLTVNSKDIKVDADGAFTVDLALKVGTNELKFIAVNKYNDTAERTISIVRADVPEIRITNYKERTTSKTTPVSGVVNYHDLTNIKVDCNGTPISLSADGTFTTTVDLKIGKNPFLFKGTTSSGNTAEQAIVIRRYEIEEEPEPEPEPEPKPVEEVYVWDWMDTIPTTEQYKRVEAVMVIDDSGSMDWTDNSNKRLEVARKFIDSSNENTKIGIVKFDNTSQIVTSKLIQCDDSGKNTLKDYLSFGNGIFDSYGTTYMYTGINDAFSLYESNDSDVMKVMIVLSDGDAYDTHQHAQTMLEASNKNIAIYTVGLDDSGSYFDYFDAYLKPLALSTGGAFYLADDADKLADIFQKIFVLIDTKTDSDGDGIADYYEDTIKDRNNNPMKMDKNSMDTDGDGLSDGEEICLDFEYNSGQTKVKVTAFMSSNPTITDTDGDGAADKNDRYPLDPAFN